MEIAIKRKSRSTYERHGMSGTRMYNQWAHMIWRCYNSNCEKYNEYGGRGISVCDEWRNSFIAFYNDMISGYSENLEIDRRDVNGDYCRENCRWVTRSVNCSNRRHFGSLPRGVSKNYKSSTYRARLAIDGIRYTIGHYKTINDAKHAHDIIYKEWFGVDIEK